MAYYTYKEVVHQIPQEYRDKFKEEYSKEPDDDPNYNGDDWLLTALWIKDLQGKIEDMEKDVEWLRCLEGAGVDNWEGTDYASEIYNEGK